MLLKDYGEYLRDEERAQHTVEKYTRDLRCFFRFCNGREVSKGLVREYKEWLITRYKAASANSMIAAVNGFFKHYGRLELCVKQYKVEKKVFCLAEEELSRDDFDRLRRAAGCRADGLGLMLTEILGATGLRVSELKYITVEAAKSGFANVSCKGKIREVYLEERLCKRLLAYARKKGIATGCIFISRKGKPLCRSSIWRILKGISREAGVLPSKVYPHNFRHFFARSLYGELKDAVKVRDLLGHSSLDTTLIYLRESVTEHFRIMRKIALLN